MSVISPRLITGQVLCLILALLLLGPGGTLAADRPVDELRILTWSEYMDPEIVAEFEQAHNARITFTYFESDETRNDFLLEADGADYDLVLCNGISLRGYRKRGWLAPLEMAQMPNLRHIAPRWTQAFPAAEGHAVPFTWGTMGIAYRRDLVSTPLDSWMDLLQPQPDLQGKIVMIKSSRDLLAAALLALGHSVNSADSQALRQAEELLIGQKPHVKVYSYISLTEQSALVTGEAVAAMVYNGDALMVQEHNENIAYVVPREGSNLWVDYWVVMRPSPEKQLAMAFLDFINQPAIAARMAKFVHYATPNHAAEALLPAAFRNNPAIYPRQEILDRSEFYQDLPPRSIKQRNTIFARVIQ